MVVARRVVQRRAAPAVDRVRVGVELVDEARDRLELALRRGEVERCPRVVISLVEIDLGRVGEYRQMVDLPY